METTMNYPKRSREEIVAWYERARQRKVAWQKETEMELKAIAEEISFS